MIPVPPYTSDAVRFYRLLKEQRPLPWRAAGCCNRGPRTPFMVGYRRMKRKAWPDSWSPDKVASAGGDFAEVEAVREAGVESLHVGSGEAARQEEAVVKSTSFCKVG